MCCTCREQRWLWENEKGQQRTVEAAWKLLSSRRRCDQIRQRSRQRRRLVRGAVRSGLNCPPTRLTAPPHALFIHEFLLTPYSSITCSITTRTSIESTFGRYCVLLSHRNPSRWLLTRLPSSPWDPFGQYSIMGKKCMGRFLRTNSAIVLFSTKLQAQRRSLLFNVCRSSLFLRPTGRSDSELFSVISPTMSRRCLPHVSASFASSYTYWRASSNTCFRSQSLCHRGKPEKGMHRTPQIIPGKCCQRQKVCPVSMSKIERFNDS